MNSALERLAPLVVLGDSLSSLRRFLTGWLGGGGDGSLLGGLPLFLGLSCGGALLPLVARVLLVFILDSVCDCLCFR